MAKKRRKSGRPEMLRRKVEISSFSVRAGPIATKRALTEMLAPAAVVRVRIPIGQPRSKTRRFRYLANRPFALSNFHRLNS